MMADPMIAVDPLATHATASQLVPAARSTDGAGPKPITAQQVASLCSELATATRSPHPSPLHPPLLHPLLLLLLCLWPSLPLPPPAQQPLMAHAAVPLVSRASALVKALAARSTDGVALVRTTAEQVVIRYLASAGLLLVYLPLSHLLRLRASLRLWPRRPPCSPPRRV
jgi:hypothetical protein